MDWLNYHHLLYFWHVAREGSVMRAAEALHLTQPTISAQLRALERSVGRKLFEKRGRHLVLTDQGRLVLRYADEIFSVGRELTQVLRGESSEQPRRFAVGLSDSLPKITSYRLLEPALRLEPRMKLLMRIDKTERLLADLSIHSLDLVLSEAPMPPSVKVRAYNHLLGECSVSVFGAPQLAQKYRRDFPQSLHQAPVVLQTSNTVLRQTLDMWFEAHGMTPQVVAEVEDMAMLQVLGQQGLGLFLAPSVVEDAVCRQYGVELVGRLPNVKERFYAISIERRLKHPAVVAISEAAKRKLFAS